MNKWLLFDIKKGKQRSLQKVLTNGLLFQRFICINYLWQDWLRPLLAKQWCQRYWGDSMGSIENEGNNKSRTNWKTLFGGFLELNVWLGFWDQISNFKFFLSTYNIFSLSFQLIVQVLSTLLLFQCWSISLKCKFTLSWNKQTIIRKNWQMVRVKPGIGIA